MKSKNVYSPGIQKILIPIVMGPEGIITLQQALVFQKKYNCEIVLLHIIKSRSIFYSFLKSNTDKKRIYKAENKIKKFAASFFGGTLPNFISIKISVGSLMPSILEATSVLNPDLIIVKKNVRKKSKWRALNRESTDIIISNVKCPVLTISDYVNPNGIEKILIPVDVTKKMANKIEWGKYLALKFDAKVHVVSVLDMNISPLKSLAYRKANEIKYSMSASGVDAKVVLIKAIKESMHQTVLSHIADIQPDLVLTLTHQESILFDNYIGKFATEIIHGSKSPVFSLVPSKDNILSNILDTLKPKKQVAIY